MYIHREVLLNEERVVIDEDYKGYNLSIASERGGHKPELCVFDGEGNIVSNKFTCFRGGMIIPSVEAIRTIMNEIDAMDNEVGVKVEVQDPLPPNSNPMDYDRFQMGSQAGNWMILHEGSNGHTSDVYHIPTGSKIHIDCSQLKRYRQVTKSDYPVAKRGHNARHCWVCDDCVPKDHDSDYLDDGVIPRWTGKDSNGIRHNYDITNNITKGTGILFCDICGE